MTKFTNQAALNKPLPKEAIKPHPTKSFLSTIKAIYVTERLTEVFGVEGWHIETDMLHFFEKEKPKKDGTTYIEFTVLCKTKLSVPAFGIFHECIAGSSNDDLGDAAKGATTDAITKIGSYLGIGIDVYKGLKDVPKTPQKEETPKQQTKPLTPESKDWSAIIAKLKGSPATKDKPEVLPITIETVKKFYSLSPENEAKLIEESSKPKV